MTAGGAAEDHGAQRRPGDGPQHGEDQPLGQQLGDDPPPAGAQCAAHRDLAGANAALGKDEAGHVGATHQQDKADNSEQQQRSRADFAPDQRFAQRLHVDLAVRVRAGKAFSLVPGERGEVLARRVRRDAVT